MTTTRSWQLNLVSENNRIQGFSLIEMMVVVAIMGIIAAIAMPLYGRYIDNTRLAQARSIAIQMFQQVQQVKLVNGEFVAADIAAVESRGLNLRQENDLTAYYNFNVAIRAADGQIFINVLPLVDGKAGLFVDQGGQAFKCANATYVEANNVANCEKM